jgi:hypothetical protein
MLDGRKVPQMTRPKTKQARKPRYMSHQADTYAGFEDYLYIGGAYYESSAQIHIKDTKDIRRLHKWLGKLLAWIDAKGER